MKKLSLLYGFVILFSLPLILSAQKSNKEVKVKTIKIIDGEKIVTDTTYNSTMDIQKEVEMVMETLTETDSLGNKTIRIEMIGDGSDSEEQEYEVIVYSVDDSDSHLFVSSPKEKRKVVKWVGEEGEEQEFEFHMEIEDMKNMREDIEQQVRIVMEETEGIEMDIKAMEAEKMIFLQELPPPPPPVQPTPDIHWFSKYGDMHRPASEKELREAGIKNQPDLMKLKELDIDNRDGVITLRFLPEQEEVSSKISVFNFFGEKVFTGKPEMVGDVFQITIDLSNKQPGTYYIQMVQKKSSVTERIKI